jgi:hypothetical protein
MSAIVVRTGNQQPCVRLTADVTTDIDLRKCHWTMDGDSCPLSEDAQLHFPRQQIAELIDTLMDLSADETGGTNRRVG